MKLNSYQLNHIEDQLFALSDFNGFDLRHTEAKCNHHKCEITGEEAHPDTNNDPDYGNKPFGCAQIRSYPGRYQSGTYTFKVVLNSSEECVLVHPYDPSCPKDKLCDLNDDNWCSVTNDDFKKYFVKWGRRKRIWWFMKRPPNMLWMFFLGLISSLIANSIFALFL